MARRFCIAGDHLNGHLLADPASVSLSATQCNMAMSEPPPPDVDASLEHRDYRFSREGAWAIFRGSLDTENQLTYYDLCDILLQVCPPLREGA